MFKTILTIAALFAMSLLSSFSQTPYGRVLTLDSNGTQQWIYIGTLVGGNGNYWSLAGNNVSGSEFLGTTNDQPLVFKANLIDAIRIYPVIGAVNIVGGSTYNTIDNGNVANSVIVVGGTFDYPNWIGSSGGGSNSIIGAGIGNYVDGDNSGVLTGEFNSVSGYNSSIVSGLYNDVSGYAGFVGAGESISISSDYSAVVGGYNNNSRAHYTFVGGGRHNTAGYDDGDMYGINSGILAGAYNETRGDNSMAIGTGLSAKSFGEVVVGLYNLDYTPNSQTEYNLNDRLFVVGNGMDWDNLSNALVILKNGNTGIGISNPTSLLDLSATNGYEQLRLRTSYTPSGTADVNGNVGDVTWDDDYIYVKTSTGWKRAALSTW
ncbi:MAG: hypothetical protein ACPLPX_02450 [Candidatus Kapaibacteriota bacterium]